MLDVENLNIEELKTSRRLVCKEALSRGWKVWLYYPENGLVRIKRDDGRELEIFSSTPPTTSAPAALRANNKYASGINFANNGLPIPQTHLVNSADEAKVQAQAILDSGRKVVIKPLSAAHGHGISTGLRAVEDIAPAIGRAEEYSDQFLVQEHLENFIDLRLTCIGYKFAAGLVRIPARVKGDGHHSVKELIDLENKNPVRGENYTKPLNIIDPGSAEIFLGQRIHEVPQADTFVGVLGTANVGTGGETIDITDELPAWLIEMAEKAAQVSELPVCGVDFLVAATPKNSSTEADLTPKLIEINVCPALFLHETPTFGQPRGVIKAYVDYLASL
ncbi:MAG: hypothetical protein JWO96_20 [Candidatus Saccharibacteria bacterium]|nr:hypothetical protein [Candidatus Saccharibacteria bacterium]